MQAMSSSVSKANILFSRKPDGNQPYNRTAAAPGDTGGGDLPFPRSMRSGIEDLIAQLSEINPALALNVPIHTPKKEQRET
jgi:hypothetical protein